MVQTKPVAEQITPLVQRDVESEEEEELIPEEIPLEDEEKLMQFKANSGQTPVVTPRLKSRINTIKGSGRPLPVSVRAFFEPRFRHDFSQVKVHTDSNAATMAKSVHAKAFTLGNNIVFNAAEFSPATPNGTRLIAHELTHVIQQSDIIRRKSVENKNNRVPKDTNDEDFEFEIGNTMDLVTVETPADELITAPEIIKEPEPKEKGGKITGEAKEGLGKPAKKLPPGCEEWIELTRTTYPYDPGKGADPLEKEFLKKYKGFKEGVSIKKPEDFNTKLKKLTANPCTCLEKLQVDGHGASWYGGGQEFGPRKYSLQKRSFGVKKGKGGKIVPYNFHIFDGITFCKPCSIVLGGCYVARNKPPAKIGPGWGALIGGGAGLLAGALGGLIAGSLIGGAALGGLGALIGGGIGALLGAGLGALIGWATSDYVPNAGDALAKALITKTGCSVKAYTGTTTTPSPGVFAGSKGKWIETKPEEKPEEKK